MTGARVFGRIGRRRRIERMEIEMRMHDVFAKSFTCCVCGEDVSQLVHEAATDGGRFCPYPVVVRCRSHGHYCEYATTESYLVPA